MQAADFDLFLRESTIESPQAQTTLGRESLYGLYLSWCSITGNIAGSERTFWAAMKTRISSTRNNNLRMTGPAAIDYLLMSRSALV
ncbi:hypothetical protein [Pseudarthrobacter sp. PS3-L1]|uniref:hypothetical protein n=1 Tax=Pseudarthrobacter sp. PS3-L1 TaxID=3046207 RepID=UPI0024B8E8B3|nr:hypothetical protein [Pseudarthrobacter sp. PS3-L1]MDJ0322084.1 hypothetical protein [Pseudarthrobacter sp. PS3-L1]